MNTRILVSKNFQYGYNANKPILSPAQGKQLKLYQVKLINRSGGAIDMGILRRFDITKSQIIQDVAGVGADVTSTIVGNATTIFTDTNDDGFVVGSKEKFGLVGFNVSTGTSGSPVFTYKYWNGTSFATLTTIAVPTYATGERIILFAAPIDWVPGGTGVTGIDTSKYNILVHATTAPSGAIAANDFWIGELIDFFPQVANNAAAQWQTMNMELALIFEALDGLVPYFSGTANAANQVSTQYLIQD